MPIKLKITNTKAGDVVNEGGEGGGLPFAIAERGEVSFEKERVALPFAVAETDPYIDFFINKLNCVEVKDGTAFVSKRSAGQGYYHH